MTAVLAIVLLVALGLGALLLALTPDATRLPPGGRAVPVLAVLIGWGFAGVGCYAWRRRPDNGTGALLAAFGIAVLLSAFSIADGALASAVSSLADPLAIAVFVHLLLAFPSGRLPDRASRLVVAAGYGAALVTEAAMLANTVEGIASAAQQVAGVGVVLAGVGLALRHGRAATARDRRGLTPLLAAGAAVLVLGAVSAGAQEAGAGEGPEKVLQLAFIAAFAALPAAFLVGLLRSRFFGAATVSGLLERIAAGTEDVGDALASALGDASVAVGYWLPEPAAYVDRAGRPFALPREGDGAAATELVHRGRRVGVLVHRAALPEDGTLLDAAALALENDRLEVALRARVEALRVSRARIVQAGDVERRRLTRDLHDGAQQRLVSVLIDLELARERFDADPDAARDLLGRARDGARAAVGELRDLASGIHPAVLSQRGLDAAVESLAARSPVPVELDADGGERPPAAVETAAYFVVAEALANVTKYAGATHARVVVRREEGLLVEIADDGVGGADPAHGTGLLGLADRVGALGGTLDVHSPDGAGTTVRAHFP